MARQRRRYERPWVRDHVKINRKFILSCKSNKFTIFISDFSYLCYGTGNDMLYDDERHRYNYS